MSNAFNPRESSQEGGGGSCASGWRKCHSGKSRPVDGRCLVPFMFVGGCAGARRADGNERTKRSQKRTKGKYPESGRIDKAKERLLG